MRRSTAPEPPRRGHRFALVAVAALAMLVPAPAAQAHAFLTSSVPADGQSLTATPTELRLAFSEPVVLSATRIDVVDGAGRHYSPTHLTVTAGAEDAAEAPVELVAALPALVRSTYQVVWETLSADDLHRTAGVVVFGVGQPVTAGGLHEPAPPPLESALRWLLLLGLSGALGGTLAIRLLTRHGGPAASRAAAAARTTAAAGALGAAVVAVLLLAHQLLTAGGDATRVLWGAYGLRWGLREAGLGLLVAATTVRPGSSAVPWRPALLVPGAALACLGTALLGHAGAGATTGLTRVVAAAAHLGAAATWAGAVAVLAGVLCGGRHRADGASTRAVLRGFGVPAAGCVAVMVVSGVYLSSSSVGSVDAALFTVYGRILLAKLALAGAVGALALASSLRLHHRRPRTTPRRAVVAEAVLAAGILALAAALTSSQPAMEPQLIRRPVEAAGTVVDRAVGDLQETVAVRPNQPGANVILIDVFNTRRPAPGPIRTVRVTVTTPGSTDGTAVPAEALTDGRWSVRTTLADPGPLTVQVEVLRDGLATSTASYAWTVQGGPDQARPAVVSTAPLAPILARAAQVLLATLLALGLALGLVRLRGARAALRALTAPPAPAPAAPHPARTGGP